MGKKIKHTQCMEGIFCDVDRRSVSQWGQTLYEFVIESAFTIYSEVRCGSKKCAKSLSGAENLNNWNILARKI